MNQSQANIHPGAKIADGVSVEPFASIYEDVEIGAGSWIGPNAVIMDGARLGKNCKVFPGAVISAIPQDLKYEGEETFVEIGDNTIIRECVTINKGTKAKGTTSIGKNSLLMAYVHVAHDCNVGDGVILVNNATLGGEVEIDDYAIVSASSLIHQFCRIGKHTMLQGGSRVGKDVPPFITAGRIPLGYEGLNSIGMRRRGFTPEKISEIQEIYRIVFHGGYNNTQASEYIENNLPASPERDEILVFMKNSKRGLIKGLNSGEEY
ncbi:acyl-ACP--UDP-N-acetylglucosamine O-acyltransferase [Bacteroidota bacterium]